MAATVGSHIILTLHTCESNNLHLNIPDVLPFLASSGYIDCADICTEIFCAKLYHENT